MGDAVVISTSFQLAYGSAPIQPGGTRLLAAHHLGKIIAESDGSQAFARRDLITAHNSTAHRQQRATHANQMAFISEHWRFLVLMNKILLLVVGLALRAVAQEPRLSDDRLQLSLFASAPHIVTPIGMAVGGQDRIFVIESHTHLPPADYDGPDGDRIKVFVDSDYDGTPDRVSVFAEGIQQAMNLAFSPNGDLFAVCAREVLRLDDDDGDGVCDRAFPVLRLVTKERYAHNSLLGITFDRDGWMYVARGNTGSNFYRFESATATPSDAVVQGYGDGGSVVRCRPDGTELEEFATGFWNPFDLKFDHAGRLFLVDNDPDARGPNRLLHVARGGDYGYKSLYGGGGNHPFQGWDGSLPGTLPFIAGTGEAPSGLIDCSHSALPAEYQHSVLATIWNENTIERFDLQPLGRSVSLRNKEVFCSGDKDFRPVAMASDSRGNIYVSDWVRVDYPNHGRGKIWRISLKEQFAAFASQPSGYFDPVTSSEAAGPEPTKSIDDAYFVAKLQSKDAFLVHETVLQLVEGSEDQRMRLLRHPHRAVRLGALLASRRSGRHPQDVVTAALRDPDGQVRMAALLWAGEAMQPELRPHLDSVLEAGEVNATLFDAYLACVENLQPSFIESYRQRTEPKANRLQRILPSGVLHRVLRDAGQSDAVRGLAALRLDDPSLAVHDEFLRKHVKGNDDTLAIAIVERIAQRPNVERQWKRLLAEVCLNPQRSAALRCEALLALGQHGPEEAGLLKSLMSDPVEDVAIEAARTQRAWSNAAPQDGITDVNHTRPTASEQWHQRLATGGSPSRGRRVFLSRRATCSKCHTIEGRNRTLGPALGSVGESKTRRQIVEAILNPSDEFPPQYQAWVVVTTDGKTHRGLQLDHKARGAIELITENGTKRRFEADEIETYRASPTSLMPDGLEQMLTIDELLDLVAFLAAKDESPSAR